jgi:hypothetical protein
MKEEKTGLIKDGKNKNVDFSNLLKNSIVLGFLFKSFI